MRGFVLGFTMMLEDALVENSTTVAAEEMQTTSKLNLSVRECVADGSVSSGD